MIISNKKYIVEVDLKDIGKGIAKGAVIGSALVGAMTGFSKMAGIGRFAQNNEPLITTPNEIQQNQTTKTETLTLEPQYHHDVIKKMIKNDEGLKTKMYLDTRGIKTVGYGHNLENTKKSIESFRNAFGDQGESVRSHVLRGGDLSSDQTSKLFDSDYQEHLNRTIKLIPNLHEHPPDVQAVLVSGTYRGHIGDSPKFRNLFNTNQYDLAASEFLNRREYKNPNPKAPGVKTRLERDHEILKSYAESMSSKK